MVAVYRFLSSAQTKRTTKNETISSLRLAVVKLMLLGASTLSRDIETQTKKKSYQAKRDTRTPQEKRKQTHNTNICPKQKQVGFETRSRTPDKKKDKSEYMYILLQARLTKEFKTKRVPIKFKISHINASTTGNPFSHTTYLKLIRGAAFGI